MSLTCQQVWQDAKNGHLHDKFMEISRNFIKVGIMPRVKKFDWTEEGCYSDRLNSIVVNYDGEFFKCSAVDYCKDTSIGNIKDGKVYDLLLNNFNKFIEGKYAIKQCGYCRILPLCTRGCYKRILVEATVCLYPSEIEKNQLIIRTLEQLTISYRE